MALNEPRNWLIAYDIADPRRLCRVHRFLSTQAVPVQYSVFATRSTPMKTGLIRAGLAEIIDAGKDDVRIYPVPEPADLTVFGKKALPEGLSVIDGRSALPLAPFALKDLNAETTITRSDRKGS
ncbi:MAG: CRISPR-associated endonuclease Cas2 [Betaproteobacteria bacterium RIFCSPLOWO2_12_FULL_62_13]|nr:MAG: CRISPR-associated endonuclease Cas2 [Betaproteobacteria bacterium RIFCSPLOWO2_12_FULL_62_13]